jgi:two-component system phosphate regulon sensor histidine kinase PhoR
VSTLLQDKEGFYDTDTRMEFYEIIDSECDRLQRLIEDLLNVSASSRAVRCR